MDVNSIVDAGSEIISLLRLNTLTPSKGGISIKLEFIRGDEN